MIEKSYYNNLNTRQKLVKMTPDCVGSRPWQALFSSLYLAEVAAGRQAVLASDEFRSHGDSSRAAFYKEMASEEVQHAAIVRKMFRDFAPPPNLACDVYDARRCLTTGRANMVERLAIVHLVFEPSAIAFLSFIGSEAPFIFEDAWAGEIQKSCRAILCDEARHVRSGREILTTLLAEIAREDIILIRRSMGSHKAFLTAGLRRFFAGSQFCEVPKLLNERYEFSFRNAVSGVM